MSTKSDNKLSQAKKEVFRTKQKVLEKFGKAKGYNDAEFETLWKRCEDHFVLLDNIKKYMENYVKALTALCVAEVKLSDDVALCFQPRDAMYEASLRNKDTIGLLDAARAEFDRVIKDDFLAVLTDYLRQAGTMKRRKNERDRRKVDMDRYKHDYQRQMEKGDHTGAMQNKRKYGGMKIAFEALNAEMIHDIPVFINDKDDFFQPVFARFMLSQADFYQRAHILYKDLLPAFQHVDRLRIHEHAHVITDEEHTASNEPIDLSKPVDKQELQAERSNYRSVASGGAPSSTGYMSQMGHAPPGSNVIGKPLPPATLSRSSMGPPATSSPPHDPNDGRPRAGSTAHPGYNPNPHAPPMTKQAPPPQHQGGYAPPPQQQQGYYDPNAGQGGYYPPQHPQPGYGAQPVQYNNPPPPQHQGGYAPPPHQQGGYAPPPASNQPQGGGPVKGPAKFPKKGAPGGGPKTAAPPGTAGRQMPPPPGTAGRQMPPPPGGGGLPQGRALYAFQGQDQTELTFAAGDVINLTRCEPGQDWWEGELRGVRGLLPANYVQKL